MATSTRQRVRESPPQARGLRRPAGTTHPPAGITPAGAGTSSLAARSGRWTRNHPRRRGDFGFFLGRGQGAAESPPQARGLRSGWPVSTLRRGITPAGAGTSHPGRTTRSTRRNHPRRRGDFYDGAQRLEHIGESPPQARGLPRGVPGRGGRPGITPAGAGTSSTGKPKSSATRNHPRRRGDFSTAAGPPCAATESPPQARGLPASAASEAPASGITPAGAGTSHSRQDQDQPMRNHPRRRGDFGVRHKFAELGGESPPQARGLLHGRLVRIVHPGITPAGAGTSRRTSG